MPGGGRATGAVSAPAAAGGAAVARAETLWFVNYFHIGRFGDRWVIVNALWHSKPRRRHRNGEA